MASLGLFVLASLVFGYGVLSRRLSRLSITGPMVFVFFGVVVGPTGFGLVDLPVSTGGVELLAEATLGLVLFADAIRIDLKVLRNQFRLPLRLLGIALPLTIIAGTTAALGLFGGLGWPEAALIGVILAPTDAALGQEVVTNRHVPVRIRQALNVESGLNDGLVLPVIAVLIGVAAMEMGVTTVSGLRFAAEQIGLALVVGVATGVVGGFLIRWSSERGWIDGIFRQLATLAVAVVALTGAELAGGNGFIAAFVAGLAFGWLAREECLYVQDFTEDTGQLLSMLTFFFFGALVAGPALDELTWQIAVYVVLSLTLVRMIPVGLSMIGSGLRGESVLFMGWFGPRGLASILFGLVIIGEGELPGDEFILLVVTWTVLASIVAHGVTARPWARRYAESFEKMDDAADMAEEEPVAEMPVRTFSLDWVQARSSGVE
jgi:NhaP-type Na+/H+ or K+/H+ antiporter